MAPTNEYYTMHRTRLLNVAGKMISQELESEPFLVKLPKEAATLESLKYPDAEALLSAANDSYTQLQRFLAHVSSARNYFKRTLELREKNLLGDPKKQEGARNNYAREFNMIQDEGYQSLYGDLRTAEELVSYLERLANASLETLQVVKKVRDAAYGRSLAAKD
jgi:hypothetical protein